MGAFSVDSEEEMKMMYEMYCQEQGLEASTSTKDVELVDLEMGGKTAEPAEDQERGGSEMKAAEDAEVGSSEAGPFDMFYSKNADGELEIDPDMIEMYGSRFSYPWISPDAVMAHSILPTKAEKRDPKPEPEPDPEPEPELEPDHEPEPSECDIIEEQVFEAHDEGDKELVEKLRASFREAAMREQLNVSAALTCTTSLADIETPQGEVRVQLNLTVGLRDKPRVLRDGFFMRQLRRLAFLGDDTLYPDVHGGIPMNYSRYY